MRTNRGRSRAVARRLIGVSLALVLLAGLVPTAMAISRTQVQNAKAHVEELKRLIAQKQQALSALEAQAQMVANRVLAAQDKYDAITQQLQGTRERLANARARYAALQGRLADRAREAYINGPGSGLEFVLGATSITDLSDRLEFLGAVTQTDVDLANEVQNTRNELLATEARQSSLQAKAAKALAEVKAQQAELNRRIDAAQKVVNQIEAKKRQAENYAAKVSKEYQRQLQLSFGVHIASSGVIRACPVGQPHVVTNSFGAPRYAGGYHLHAGDDIMAPEGTPILAPFDGTAVDSYNGLGGNTVYVYGSAGYVYNAHLSRYGSTGNVSAGTVIGYVGNTGDAQGGPTHDHFEWHPHVIPSSWPPSPYGYSVLSNGAVNPYPLLVGVC